MSESFLARNWSERGNYSRQWEALGTFLSQDDSTVFSVSLNSTCPYSCSTVLYDSVFLSVTHSLISSGSATKRSRNGQCSTLPTHPYSHLNTLTHTLCSSTTLILCVRVHHSTSSRRWDWYSCFPTGQPDQGSVVPLSLVYM